MENSSNMSESVEKIRNILFNMKSPLKYNLSKINEILDLFDKTTIALLNPIKKLKISYAAKMQTLSELQESEKKLNQESYHLDKFDYKIDEENIEKMSVKNSTEIINLNDSEEELENINKISNQIENRYDSLITDFAEKFNILNNMLNTNEFKKLTNFSENLNSGKKKTSKETIILEINDDLGQSNENDSNRFKSHKIKNGKNKSKITNDDLDNLNGDNNLFNNIFKNENHEDDITKSFESGADDNNINRGKKLKNEIKNNKSTPRSVSKNGILSNIGLNSKKIQSKSKNFRNGSLLKRKTKRFTSNPKILNNSRNKSNSFRGSKTNNSNIKSLNIKKEEILKENYPENSNENDIEIDMNRGRKLTDEECLEKMKEKLPNDNTLTKTFITRKLRKKVMIKRSLDYNNFDSTVKNVENTIPKKSGPNNFVKFSLKINTEEELKNNSNIVYFIKDLFITHFIVLKKKDNLKKIIIGGSINKDIIFFLKKIANCEFKDKFKIVSAKIKAYAFYEELIYEFSRRKDICLKNITQDDIDELIKQYEYLTHMRNCYEEIKNMRIN